MSIDQKDSALHLTCPVLPTDSRWSVSSSLTDSELRMKIQKIKKKKKTELEGYADFLGLTLKLKYASDLCWKSGVQEQISYSALHGHRQAEGKANPSLTDSTGVVAQAH